MRKKIAEVSPGRNIDYFFCNTQNYLIPELGEKIASFANDFFQGFQEANKSKDNYWECVFCSLGSQCLNWYACETPIGLTSDLEIDAFKENSLATILRTEFIGWNPGKWTKQIQGKKPKRLYEPFIAGIIDIAGIGRIQNQWVVSIQEHHTIPLDLSFIQGIVNKYNAKPTDLSLPLEIKVDNNSSLF